MHGASYRRTGLPEVWICRRGDAEVGVVSDARDHPARAVPGGQGARPWRLRDHLSWIRSQFEPEDRDQRVLSWRRGDAIASEFDGVSARHNTLAGVHYGLDRYLDEARLVASFDNHPNIVWVKN